MLFKSSGKLVYNPRTHLKQNEKWVVLLCEEDLTLYYKQEFFYRPALQRPIWGAHCSLVRNEKIINQDAWEFSANKFIDFEYEPGVKDNGNYYWLKIYSDELLA